ncbi:MAG: hypothetical protein LBQ40_02275 [Clostridiales bacterium]|jgi:hypothetical protein|nr:hypothetical protein [Clostridiales bacterium]
MVGTMEMKRSNLVLPTCGYELDREEMCYVDGGFNWVTNGFYMSNQDILDVLFLTAANWASITAVLAAAKFIVATSWLNTFVGIGNIIWGLLGVGSVILGIYLVSALSQRKGLELTMTFTKVFFVPVPTGLSLEVK